MIGRFDASLLTQLCNGVGFKTVQNRGSSETPDWEQGDKAKRHLVHADGQRTASTLHETGLPPEKSRQLDWALAPLKNELALWRAFLGNEIHAILRDKD
jgi:hypothetical protein